MSARAPAEALFGVERPADREASANHNHARVSYVDFRERLSWLSLGSDRQQHSAWVEWTRRGIVSSSYSALALFGVARGGIHGCHFSDLFCNSDRAFLAEIGRTLRDGNSGSFLLRGGDCDLVRIDWLYHELSRGSGLFLLDATPQGLRPVADLAQLTVRTGRPGTRGNRQTRPRQVVLPRVARTAR